MTLDKSKNLLKIIKDSCEKNYEYLINIIQNNTIKFKFYTQENIKLELGFKLNLQLNRYN